MCVVILFFLTTLRQIYWKWEHAEKQFKKKEYFFTILRHDSAAIVQLSAHNPLVCAFLQPPELFPLEYKERQVASRHHSIALNVNKVKSRLAFHLDEEDEKRVPRNIKIMIEKLLR